MTGLVARVPDAVPEEPHHSPEWGTVARVLACLRASVGCWRCADDEVAVAPRGVVNGRSVPVPLYLCGPCRASPGDSFACWRCATSGPALITCGETVATTDQTAPLHLCPGCLDQVALAYATCVHGARESKWELE